jgi:hypothetical protein
MGEGKFLKSKPHGYYIYSRSANQIAHRVDFVQELVWLSIIIILLQIVAETVTKKIYQSMGLLFHFRDHLHLY